MEFEAWPKIPRLNRDMIITEKIDGTNGAVVIEKVEPYVAFGASDDQDRLFVEFYDGLFTPTFYEVGAQSRKRLISPLTDNHGFANWVWANAGALVKTLGPGRHFGEWWGSGIQRGYGLEKGEKRFSLFNVKRYGDLDWDEDNIPGMGLVPTLYEGPFDTTTANNVLYDLAQSGSVAASGYMNPEGIIVFHTALNGVFKATIKNDEKPKGSTE